MYSYRCEKCGAYLDPGELCDCEEELERERQRREKRAAGMVVLDKKSNQFVLNFQEGVAV